jgi:hypothetical protein
MAVSNTDRAMFYFVCASAVLGIAFWAMLTVKSLGSPLAAVAFGTTTVLYAIWGRQLMVDFADYLIEKEQR